MSAYGHRQDEIDQKCLLAVNVQDASSATKSLVPATEEDAPNTILTQHGSAHDTWLDGDIEVRLVENLDGVLS